MKEYRFPPTSGFVRFITILTIAIAVAVATSVYFVYEDLGGYITASVVGIMIVPILLHYFALPRKISISDTSVDIVCTLKMVRIPLNEITEVRRIPSEQNRKFVPVWASFGVFGYSGWYLNEGMVKVYATRMSNLIEITTERRKVVICSKDPEALVRIIKEATK